MKKISISLFIMFLFVYQTYSQTSTYDYFAPRTTSTKLDWKKPSYSLEMGTSFMKTRGSGSIISSYIAPSLNYQFTPKMSVTAGFMVSNNNFSSLPVYTNEGISRTNGSFTQNTMFLSADYQATERLKIEATILYSMNKGNPYQTQLYGNDNISYSFSADYKISDNIHIGIQVQHSEGNNPYGFNSYGYDQPVFYAPPQFRHGNQLFAKPENEQKNNQKTK